MAVDKKIKKVRLELNEAQAMVVQVALEEWFRLRMGQSFDLANDLAFMGYKRDEAHPERFDACITKRNSLEYVIKAMFNIAWPHYGTPHEVEPRTHTASDIWSVLRHELWKARTDGTDQWCMAAATPIKLGPEPLPTVTVTLED